MRLLIRISGFVLAVTCLYIIGQSGHTLEGLALLFGYSFFDWGEV